MRPVTNCPCYECLCETNLCFAVLRAPTSPSEVFAGRRQRMRQLLEASGVGEAVFASGLPQPRNFAHNLYPFRASSHFLYLVGAPLEAAVLSLGPEHEVLYLDPPDEAAALWTGPQPSFEVLADRLALEVRPLDEWRPTADTACTPPVDALTTWWLSDLLDRSLEPAYGEPQSEQDAELAAALIELRLVHDEAALVQLQAAIDVTHTAHVAGMLASQSAEFEYHVVAEMEAAIRRGHMQCAYQPIVTVHGEVLHNERHDQPVATSDLLLADVGAETPEGWAADITRTWPVRGTFSPTQRDLYEVVLTAQQAAIDRVRPGVRYRDVHVAALAAMTDGLKELGILRGSQEELMACAAASVFFPHGVGHLLGLDVHDMEDLGDAAGYPPGRQRSNDPATRYLRLDRDLSPNMVVTIEPGFYRVPGLIAAARVDAALASAIDFECLSKFHDVRGIRIEDDVLVTSEACKVLSAAIPKTVADVEAACGSNG